MLSHVLFFLWPPWPLAYQATLSIEFTRPEYWNGLPFATPRDLPNTGKEPAFCVSPALAGEFFTSAPPGMPITKTY